MIGDTLVKSGKVTDAEKVVVSTRAIVQRINRVLKDQDEMLKVARDGSRLEQQVGQYYIVDFRRNRVARHGVSLPHLARELGVLREYENVGE